MRYFFIVNPEAGAGSARARFESMKKRFEEAQIDFGCTYSTCPGESRLLAENAANQGEKIIIAVGGDGTAQEVASSLINRDVVMGILPFGTGNDFAKCIGLPISDDDALFSILRAFSHKKIDGMRANGRFFINVAGFGFDADVVVNTEKHKKKHNGMLPYLLGIMESLLHLKRFTVTLRAEGVEPVEGAKMPVPQSGEEFTTEAILVSACNGTHFAGGINVAPLADASDGKMDVCIVTKLGRPGFLSLLPRYMKGKHLKSKNIRYFRATSLTCTCSIKSALNLDGELYSTTPATFEMLPGALSMITA